MASGGIKNPQSTPEEGSSSVGRHKPKYTYVPKSAYQKQMAAYRARLGAVMKHNDAAANTWARCVDSGQATACPRDARLALPPELDIRPAGDPADAPAAPALSPQELAYVAVARLRLSAPSPVVGPSPELNPWKMAAVGYPLWLSASGNLDPAPVSDSVYDVSVSLDARLVRVVFEMGDGGRVSCTDVSRKWSRSVRGQESPVCGYTYEKPSLPQGDYTITATTVWAVGWTINGTSGTLPFSQSASTELPVGELQVLVR